MSSLPLCELELRANDQGRSLESSVLELKSKIRGKSDVKTTARQHWGWLEQSRGQSHWRPAMRWLFVHAPLIWT